MQEDSRKAWFGNRRFSAGFPRPMTWEGWLVVLALVAAIVLDAWLLGIKTPLGIVVIAVVVVVYALVSILKGDRG